MCVRLLVLLLLACSCQASNFLGTVMTFYPWDNAVVLRYKLGYETCQTDSRWTCHSGDCIEGGATTTVVDKESSGEWCQTEVVSTLRNSTQHFELRLINITNNVTVVQAVTRIDLRNRSDIGQANTSPVTTMLPVLRLPSNCPRNLTMLTFDPDGDMVRCRYENTTSVLDLSSSCLMTFSPRTNSSKVEGVYAVQLLMEDFPPQNINVTDGEDYEILTNKDAISQVPIQFVLRVDPPVPSCDEGVFLPTFLSPTVANGKYFYVTVNTTLAIPIYAQSSMSNFSELLFSGPSSMTKETIGNGSFLLFWTPSDSDVGQSHPVCFVVQAIFFLSKHHSELRCVVVVVEHSPHTPANNNIVVALRAKISSLVPLSEDDIQKVGLPQLKIGLLELGLPADITLRMVNFSRETTATPNEK
ncbi:uncharacterized protein LOC129168197 [Dunckerocampus dactyliophorus]|uniref:uncharacterized protein LOC129168197 n=1 Tax=Dunckerocampus dactyliophorus TaxID=161453 RepID=UPI0024075419|nr:uncharacterized protein LOC129168197 [Dunckerocampus dactyliophorus]